MVVAAEDAEALHRAAAQAENLEATPVAVVTEEPASGHALERQDHRRHQPGLPQHQRRGQARRSSPPWQAQDRARRGASRLGRELPAQMACRPERLLPAAACAERFDSTIGAGTVLMPFGGKYQLTPVQAMVSQAAGAARRDRRPAPSWPGALTPFDREQIPYHGAYLAVVGVRVASWWPPARDCEDAYLTFQEYFRAACARDPGALGQAPRRPARARSGRPAGPGRRPPSAARTPCPAPSEKLDVPPTLVSFAVAPAENGRGALHRVQGRGSTRCACCPAYGRRRPARDREPAEALSTHVTSSFAAARSVAAYTPWHRRRGARP